MGCCSDLLLDFGFDLLLDFGFWFGLGVPFAIPCLVLFECALCELGN